MKRFPRVLVGAMAAAACTATLSGTAGATSPAAGAAVPAWAADAPAPLPGFQLILPGSPAAAAARTALETFRFKNRHSNLCLEIRGDSTADGATANQWTCNGSATQAWISGSNANGGFKFTNVNSGKCLEIRGDSTANGATANQWTCNGSKTQGWYWYGNSDGSMYFRNVNSVSSSPSGKCLEILSWRTGDGDPAGQWDCHYGYNQLWFEA
ncbi:RICIN domain-containing protein [Streptomyces sp. XY431]|uniref:RICIN domain-containing protein n=1 Tax=Streptomyces sp. XY431 TaxID=1415562 RepID=UPI0006AD9683|nr:RICIN domain-containing protein [Streptomyces sp. XY431]